MNTGLPDGEPDDQPATPAGFEISDFVTDNLWDTAPLTPDTIKLVQITVVARQMRDDVGISESQDRIVATPVPINISDHNHANGVFVAGDIAAVPLITQYPLQRRRVLTRTVETRNIGF